MPTETLRPNGDLTARLKIYPDAGEDYYEDIDEVVSDEDSTYLYWDVASSKTDYFTVADSAVGAGIIVSVEVHGVFKYTPYSAGGSSGYLRCGTVAGSTSAQSITISRDGNYNENYETWTTSPVTDASWTWAEINDMKIGLTMGTSSSGHKVYCTQLWAVVNYALPGESSGEIAIKSTRFHYFDTEGDERYFEGLVVE